MGHLSTPRTDTDCHSGTPGHRPALGTARPELLVDAAAWIPVTVFVDPPTQSLTLACPSGVRWRGHHHGVGELAAALRCTFPVPGHDDGAGLPLVGAVTCHWHPGARLLAVPADPHRSAGRAYVQLAARPLKPCRLEHDEQLAAQFAAVTGTPVRR